MSLLTQISERITQLTNVVNGIIVNAKKISDFEQIDLPLLPTDIVLISRNGVTYKAEKSSISQDELDPVFNNWLNTGFKSTSITLGYQYSSLGVEASETQHDLNLAIIDRIDEVVSNSDYLYIKKTSIGSVNGVAGLDANSKILLENIPDTILGQVKYKGIWDASLNNPTLDLASQDNKGWYYIASTDGTYLGIDYKIGDWIISDGIEWSKVDNSDAVTTVFGRLGNILAVESDYESFYPKLSSSYVNPSWISSLILNKITSPTSNTTWSMGGNTLTMNFTNPVGGLNMNMTGGWSGHIFEILDNSTVPDGVIGDHMIHLETDRVNVIPLHVEHNSRGGIAVQVDGILKAGHITGSNTMSGSIFLYDPDIIGGTGGRLDIQTISGSDGDNFGSLHFSMTPEEGFYISKINYTDSSIYNITVNGGIDINGTNPDSIAKNGFPISSFRKTVPASATATGVKGQYAFSTTYFYICVETNTWKRVAIATF